jgi:hypothetical protein
MGGNSMRMRRHSIGFRGWAAWMIVGLIEIATASTAGAVTWQDEIGYTDLVAQLTAANAAIPTGAGVTIMQTEGIYNGGYRPDSSQFSGVGLSYQGLAGTNTTISGHATTVGSYIYGAASINPGITNVIVDDATSWMNTYLYGASFGYYPGDHKTTGSTTTYTLDYSPPMPASVVNCSWIDTTGTASVDTSTLQLLDYSINKNDYVCVVAVSANSAGAAPATLLAQSYNAICVGVSSGLDSTGSTTINGAGRIKPDIVAPAPETSYATAMVSSASAFLLSAAGSMPSSADASHSQTIKAILMAGATKTTLPSWSHTPSSPLDSTYGAGELNVERSYAILTGGEQKAGATITNAGWDYSSISSSSKKTYYDFTVASGNAVSELSALLTWNAVVSGTETVVRTGRSSTTSYAYTTTLANLDLNLYKIGSDGTYTPVDYSDSAVDNVQLLYETYLASGNYAIEVVSSSAADTNYSLAWYMTTEAVPEPGTLALLLVAGSVTGAFYWRRKDRVSEWNKT